MSAISVLAIRKLDGKSAVKAFVDIRIGGVTIKSARVIQQPDGPRGWPCHRSRRSAPRTWSNCPMRSKSASARLC